VRTFWPAWIGLHWPFRIRMRVGKTVPTVHINFVYVVKDFPLRGFSLIFSFYLQDNVIIKPVNKYGSREATASQVIRYGLLNLWISSLMIWFEENYCISHSIFLSVFYTINSWCVSILEKHYGVFLSSCPENSAFNSPFFYIPYLTEPPPPPQEFVCIST
jgi:hypothetical protein